MGVKSELFGVDVKVASDGRQGLTLVLWLVPLWLDPQTPLYLRGGIVRIHPQLDSLTDSPHLQRTTKPVDNSSLSHRRKLQSHTYLESIWQQLALPAIAARLLSHDTTFHGPSAPKLLVNGTESKGNPWASKSQYRSPPRTAPHHKLQHAVPRAHR